MMPASAERIQPVVLQVRRRCVRGDHERLPLRRVVRRDVAQRHLRVVRCSPRHVEDDAENREVLPSGRGYDRPHCFIGRPAARSSLLNCAQRARAVPRSEVTLLKTPL